MKTKTSFILSSSFVFLMILLLSSSTSYTCSTELSEDSVHNFVIPTNEPLDETILEITKIETYPSPAILNQPLFVNITVKNSGQFTMAEIKNVKAEADVNISQDVLVLEGSITGLEPGQQQIARFNLTFLEIGVANVTFTISTDNTQAVSKSVLVEVIDDGNTATLSLRQISMILSLLPVFLILKFRKKKRIR